MASSRASTAACETSASTNICSPTSTRREPSSKNGGSTTTPTDHTRASTGSHRLSSQNAPIRGKTGQESHYERGQVGEQVRSLAYSSLGRIRRQETGVGRDKLLDSNATQVHQEVSD